ncbi:hypothetical protein pb186bvf_015221 [Paramecium bursaria]
MQLLDNIAQDFQEVNKTQLTKSIIQELEMLGYHEIAKQLIQEAGFEQNIIFKNKIHFINGEWNQIINSIQDTTLLNMIKKQTAIELILAENFDEGLKLLRTLQLSEIEINNISRSIFANAQPDIQQMRITLYQLCYSFVEFNKLEQKTQIDLYIQNQLWKHSFDLLKQINNNNQPIPQYCSTVYKGFDNEIWIAKFSDSGNLIGCATKQKTIYIIKTQQDEYQVIPYAHGADINGILFDKDEKILYTCSNDCHIFGFDVSTRQKVFQIKTNFPVLTIAIDEQILYFGGQDHFMELWKYGQQFRKIKLKPIKNILIAQNLIIVQSAVQTQIQLLDKYRDYEQINQIEENQPIISVSLSDDKLQLISVVCKYSPEIHLWDLRTLELLHRYVYQMEQKMELNFIGFANYLVGGSENGKITFFDKQNHRNQQNLQAHSKAVNYVSYNQNLNLLITASDDQQVKIWTTQKVEQLEKQIDNQYKPPNNLGLIQENFDDGSDYQSDNDDDDS